MGLLVIFRHRVKNLPGAAGSFWGTGTCSNTATSGHRQTAKVPTLENAGWCLALQNSQLFILCASVRSNRKFRPAQRPSTFRSWHCAALAAAWTWSCRPPRPPPLLGHGWLVAGVARRFARPEPAAALCAQTWTACPFHLRSASQSEQCDAAPAAGRRRGSAKLDALARRAR